MFNTKTHSLIASFLNIGLVLVGGGIGAVARYSVENLMKVDSSHWMGSAIWVINTVGCLVIGLLAGWLLTSSLSAALKHEFSLFLITGICGGFTAFSSFTLDCIKYFERGQIVTGVVYVFLTLFVSFVFCGFGYWLGTKI